MKTTVITFISILISLIGTTIAQDVETSNWSFSLNSMWKSQYLALPDNVVYDKPVIQTSITATHQSGWYFDVWHSGEAGSHFLDSENDGASEVDLTVGWAGKVWELDVDMGISHWDYGKVGNLKDGDTVYTYLQVGKKYQLNPDHSIKPFVRIWGYTMTNSWPGDGVLFTSGVCHEWAVNKTLSACSDIQLMYDDGVYGNDHGFLGSLSTTLLWKVNDKLTIKAPYFGVFTPLQSLDDNRKTEFVLGAGFGWNL